MVENVTQRPREPWERIPGEPDRAYRAFEVYLGMPLGERSFEGAYRVHAANPLAAGPSDTFKGWTKRYRWRERAAAWDDAVRRARRDGVLAGTKDQWADMSAELEKMQADLMHLAERAYLKAVEIFEQRLTPENHTLAHAVQMSKVVLEIYKHSSELHKTHGPQDPWPEISDEELDQALESIEKEFGANPPGEGAERAKEGPA
jgi:hypothetical protein